MIRVEVLNNEDDESLIKFLDDLSTKDSSVLGYHYPYFRDMLYSVGIGDPFYLILKVDEEIKALIPGFIKKSEIGNVYSSMPFFGPNAGVLCSNENKLKYSKILIDFLLNYIKNHNFISVSFYTSFLSSTSLEESVFSDNFPLKINKFTSYFKLEGFNIPPKVMYDIRKSLKSNVLVSTEITQDRIDALYFIYIQNCNYFGIPEKPKTCIEILCNQSSNSKDNVTVYFAELDGVVIGGLIMIWSKSVASYFLPCSLNEHRSLQSNTFLISIAIEEAKKRNIKIWNWESSPSVESGVYSFKQKWGSVNSDYNIYIKPLKEEQFFLDLGKTQIASLFPNYFVYPFTNITKD